MLCSPPIYTLDMFTMDESKKSVTESEGGSMSGSTVESKESLSLREDQHVAVLLTTTEREARK